jgi:hypothetical protein
MNTVIELDPTDTGKALAHFRRMIYQVDCCTRGEAIHVQRRNDEHRVLATSLMSPSVIAGHPSRAAGGGVTR